MFNWSEVHSEKKKYYLWIRDFKHKFWISILRCADRCPKGTKYSKRQKGFSVLLLIMFSRDRFQWLTAHQSKNAQNLHSVGSNLTNDLQLLNSRLCRTIFSFELNWQIHLCIFHPFSLDRSQIHTVLLLFNSKRTFKRTLLFCSLSHPSLLKTFGFSATSPNNSYLPLIFGKNTIFLGYFQNVW